MNTTYTTTGPAAFDAETSALLASTVERILEDLCTPQVLRAAERGDPSATAPLARAITEAGLVDALLGDGADTGPDTSGAIGLPELRPVVVACGRWGLPLPLPETLAAQALARLAGATLPAGFVTLALARVDGERVRVDGLPFPAGAEHLVCSVDHGRDRHRLLLFSIGGARAAPSPSVGPDPRGALVLDADAGRVLGELPPGVSALTAGAAIRAAQIAGACERVLATSVRYANDRVQFGRPIGKFQAIQQQLAVAAEWSAAASMAGQLALAGPGVAFDPQRVAAAKQVAGTAAHQCAEIAHAVHGAIGATAEYDLQLSTRRLWAWACEFGSSLHWARVLGAEVLEGAPALSWDAVVRTSGG